MSTNLRNQSSFDWVAHGALFTVAWLYAINYFVAKGIFEFLPPAGAVGVRTGAAAVLFVITGIATGKFRLLDSRKDWMTIILCSLFGVVLNQNFFLAGLDRTTEVNASVIMTITPVIVVLISVGLGRERLNWMGGVGLIIALLGAGILSLNGRTLSIGSDTVLGDLFIFINAASYAGYLVLVQPLMRKYHFLTIMPWLLLFACLVNIPFGMSDILTASWTDMPVSIRWSLLYLVVGVTYLVYALNAFGLSRISASQVGIYIYLQPVIVSLLAAFLPNKDITLSQVGCMLLVCAGVGMVVYRKKR